MKKFICENCGANDFIEKNGYKICKYCGSKFLINLEDIPIKDTQIALGDDVKRLLSKCENDPVHARRYVNLILDIDPTNKEVYKYL